MTNNVREKIEQAIIKFRRKDGLSGKLLFINSDRKRFIDAIIAIICDEITNHQRTPYKNKCCQKVREETLIDLRARLEK